MNAISVSTAKTPIAPKFGSSLPARRAGAMVAAAVLLACASAPALAGRIVVNHDEWTWTDTGFSLAGGSNASNFAQNVVKFLDTDGTPGGNVLIYSNNFAFGASFSAALTAAGYTPTYDTGALFTLANLLTFDAVYLAGGGFGKNDAVLASYVNAGGGVFIAGGTGAGGAAGEAARWNGFLGGFGLAFDGSNYNGVGGTLAVTGVHPIFSGVSQLYYNNGNTVLDIGDANSMIVQTPGLIGVYDNVGAVPEPETYALMLAGLGALGFVARRRGKA